MAARRNNKAAWRAFVARELAPVGARSGPDPVVRIATASQPNASKLARHRVLGNAKIFAAPDSQAGTDPRSAIT
ncbi:hypothetical protein EIY72_05195 [Pseudomonas vancouverensis]|uniref:Uncharacterized protein n=1 Tax=Pseudomonas vancouverensis TaxID=95300 RepID=A0A4R4KI07_PSEVA|nr:hypothetical protein EIY72_05195 [Pseudomonas vancouverensis]